MLLYNSKAIFYGKVPLSDSKVELNNRKVLLSGDNVLLSNRKLRLSNSKALVSDKNVLFNCQFQKDLSNFSINSLSNFLDKVLFGGLQKELCSEYAKKWII